MIPQDSHLVVIQSNMSQCVLLGKDFADGIKNTYQLTLNEIILDPV